MAIDIHNEQLLSLSDAARSLPKIGGKRPHMSTIWRWCRRGCRGVKLDYVRLGNRICTTREALSKFANRLAEADENAPAPPLRPQNSRRSKHRDKAIEAADAELAAAGI